MAAIEIIENIEQLRKFLNENNLLEIALRDKNKKFRAIKKIALGDLQQSGAKEQFQKVMNILGQNDALLQKNAAMLGNVANLANLNLLFGAVNLCATCAGFVIMNAKFNEMSNQINQVLVVLKQIHGTQTNHEFRNVLSSHSDMLDHRKTKSPYTEIQMRQLVDSEYTVLCKLTEVLLKSISEDTESLIFFIYSLASMLTVSLRYFDEVYYFSNKGAIGDGDIWHSSHANWMNAFNNLLSAEVIEKIQDHGIFELGLTTAETDAYYISLCDQVRDMIQQIEDNQTLIATLADETKLNAYREQTNLEIRSSIERAIEEAGDVPGSAEIRNACADAMKKVAVA